MLKPKSSIFIAALLLQGCTTELAVSKPPATAPQRWSILDDLAQRNAPEAQLAALTPGAEINQRWWQVFNDPQLTLLIERALQNNLNLKLAQARVEEVQAQRQAASATLMPQVYITAGASRGNDASSGYNSVSTTTQAALEASWEIDLFGKNRTKTSAADALLASSVSQANAVKVSLLAEVARHYFALRNLQRQMHITQANLQTQRETLRIIQARFQQGEASDFDLQRVSAQVATTQAAMPGIQEAADATRNRLSTLVGEFPGQLNLPPLDSPILAQQAKLLLAAPSEVLLNRPDVQAANQALDAASKNTSAEQRSWLPAVNLLGLFGILDNSSFSAQPWSLGTSLVQPLLNFGSINSRIAQASAREKQALITYQQTLLSAVEDMETALSTYFNQTSRYHLLQQAYSQSAKALTLAQEQFKVGSIDLLDQLIIERDSLAAEASLAEAETNLNQALVAVYAASGGGWQ